MSSTKRQLRLERLRQMKSAGRKFAMLTAYDYPTAVAAHAAGVHALLVGDSAAMVVLGLPNTREISVAFLVAVAQAVRRGAPDTFLAGDMPFEPMLGGPQAILDAALRFRDEAGCDAVKLEVETHHAPVIESLARADIAAIAHLGLRPQSVLTPDGYRAQARDLDSIERLVADARRMTDAGASMLLLEAVPNEASAAVVAAVSIPVIGCGAGPACDGHVVVTHDMLGLGAPRPPRFVPQIARIDLALQDAMRQYVQSIEHGRYPSAQHAYPMAKTPAPTA